MKAIDLRSDTVTRPTPAMRDAMAHAEVGDDCYREDPTVNRLQAMAARMLGTEAALLVTSGTQGNLAALLAHCQRGEEYIAGQQAHAYRVEAGGAAVLGGIQPQPLDFAPDGTLDLDAVAAAIKPDDEHYARTRLLCLENTWDGKVLPLAYLERAAGFARAHGLAVHLDGARVFNAAVALGVPVSDIAGHFDSVTFCLSKGLGAPVGSMLCGPRGLIERARRWRKMLGGAMRQAGVVAAAGIVALENHVERLAEDHRHARALAEALAPVAPLAVDPAETHTNMVFARPGAETAAALAEFLRGRGILITPGRRIRLVTHLDVDAGDVERVVAAMRDFFERPR